MDGEPAVLLVAVEVDQHGETEPSERDHAHQRPDDEPVARVRNKVAAGEGWEPGVAEGHDRVEYALKHPLTYAEAHAYESDAQGYGPDVARRRR